MNSLRSTHITNEKLLKFSCTPAEIHNQGYAKQNVVLELIKNVEAPVISFDHEVLDGVQHTLTNSYFPLSHNRPKN